MLDLGGIILLIVALTGVIKGLTLPVWIPLGVTFIALFLLLYQGMFKHSRLTFVHAATVWVALIWIMGSILTHTWGNELLLQLPIWLLLLTTPLAAIAPHQAQKRLSTASAGKKLELTHTDTSPVKEWGKILFLQQKSTEKPQKPMEMIMFDLGEEINYENK